VLSPDKPPAKDKDLRQLVLTLMRADPYALRKETKDFYNSLNGDRWVLVHESDSVRVFVRHIPNLPSGGRTSDVELGAFLCESNYGPQHVESAKKTICVGRTAEMTC
jgi:hypothetical protein